MTIKLRHVSRWKKLAAGKYIDLRGEPRVVDLEVNVEADTRFDVLRFDGPLETPPVFLTVAKPGDGPKRIQFAVDGNCGVLATSDGEVWYDTSDGAIESFAVRTQSFTELEQRMESSPEMEIAILKANIRLEQRRAEVAELLLAKRQREEAAAADADPETGEVDDGEKPTEDDAGEGSEAAAATDAPAPKPKS